MDAHYVRVCERFLDSRGLTVESVNTFDFATPKERWEAWIAESLLTAIRSLAKDDKVMALRCTLQACEYVGRLGGYWPSPGLSDAYLTVRNALEDCVSEVERFGGRDG